MITKDLMPVRAGFLPLTDAAILIAAREKGFAAGEGIDLLLHREASWANIRDRLSVGHFQVAHLLAPMPIAANLGLTPMPLELIAPMALGLGGNAVTIASAHLPQIRESLPVGDLDAGRAGRAVAALVAERKARNLAPLTLAVVHPHSGHNYDLRYWLAASGVDPVLDVDIVIVPPPLMADALETGRIDGFCVGEPWSSVAMARGAGEIITTKSSIWHSSPEKVLGVTADFNRREPEMVHALLRALVKAAQWCGGAANSGELATILGATAYLDQPPHLIRQALVGKFAYPAGGEVEAATFFTPYDRAATFPWLSHALWFYSQMVRWGDAEWSAENVETARATFRPDIYRAALSGMAAPLPAANAKVEGALTNATPVGSSQANLLLGPDGFFDGKVFDPDLVETYVQDQMGASIA
ncbi:MAG: ABC transporter substrate-binding protein [Flavobacteriaceae bacterium]